jgi:hypothetical protein
VQAQGSIRSQQSNSSRQLDYGKNANVYESHDKYTAIKLERAMNYIAEFSLECDVPP